jgi:hypothetical protein
LDALPLQNGHRFPEQKIKIETNVGHEEFDGGYYSLD